MLRHTALALLLLLMLPVISTSQTGKFDSLDQERSMQCMLGTETASWTKDSETVIHVRVRNTSSKTVELEVFPVFHLKVKQPNNTLTKEADGSLKRAYKTYSEYWAPADLKRDAPAPINLGSEKHGVTITPKKKFVRLAPNGEKEFTVHASNLKWANRMSSAWPSYSLFTLISSGEYELSLELGSVTCSHSVTINLEQQKSDPVE